MRIPRKKLIIEIDNKKYKYAQKTLFGVNKLVVNIRNLARFIRLSIAEENAEERENKAAILKLFVAFMVATKLQLRGEKPNQELKKLLNEKQALEIDSAKRISLQIALWIGEYLQQQLKLGRIADYLKLRHNVVSKTPLFRVEAFVILGRYSYI